MEADTEHLTGETDTTATANPKTYPGFAFNGTAGGTVASGNIAGDGSLVLKLYYTRDSYEVSYAYTGTVPADASARPEKAAVKYGASVTVAEAAKMCIRDRDGGSGRRGLYSARNRSEPDGRHGYNGDGGGKEL